MSQQNQYEIAPEYGTRVYRRRIRLSTTDGMVSGEMEDNPHAMRCRIRHAGGKVKAVEADFHRHPMSTCPGAAGPLADLVGMDIAVEPHAFFANGRARANCTHMLDLAWLMLRHAVRGGPDRFYAIDVPDEIDGRTLATLHRDGRPVLALTVKDGAVESPEPYAGKVLRKGFVGWALNALEGDDLEAALVLHKGLFVAWPRRFVLPSGPLKDWEQRLYSGACFGFAAERIATAERTSPGPVDFTNDAHRLLTFALPRV